MATVTGLTAERMEEMEAETIIDGDIVGDNLILTTRGGTPINAGNVRGPTGLTGPAAINVVTSGTRPGSPTTGLFIYETDTGRLYVWNGSAWVYRGGTWICTSSTRPASPFAGLTIYETNTKLLYTYDGAAWVYSGGTIICTSSTRPASPIEGLPIYETDTDRQLIWNGVAWRQPWNRPWGSLGTALLTGGANNGGGVLTGNVAITAVANRLLKITVQVGIYVASDVGTGILFIRRNTANLSKATPKSTGTATGDVHSSVFFGVDTPPAGATTYDVHYTAVTATTRSVDSNIMNSFIIVEDMGPNGAAA
jgi:hypothetical protein